MNPVQYVIQMLRRSWWIGAICLLAALNTALISAFLETPLYRVNSTFVVSADASFDEDSREIVDSLNALESRNRAVVATYVEILNSRSIFQSAGATLQLPSNELREYDVSVVVLPSANVLNLSVTGPDPVKAVSLANAIRDEGLTYIDDLYGEIHDINQLDQATVPRQPFSPNPLRDAVLAGVLGLAIGTVIMFLREQLVNPGALFGDSATAADEELAAMSDSSQSLQT
jgi:capsular polysaccharide biosynthesis protein